MNYKLYNVKYEKYKETDTNILNFYLMITVKINSKYNKWETVALSMKMVRNAYKTLVRAPTMSHRLFILYITMRISNGR